MANSGRWVTCETCSKEMLKRNMQRHTNSCGDTQGERNSYRSHVFLATWEELVNTEGELYHCFGPQEVKDFLEEYYPTVSDITCKCAHNGKDHIHWIGRKAYTISPRTFATRWARWRKAQDTDYKNSYRLKPIKHCQQLLTALVYINTEKHDTVEKTYYHTDLGRPDLALRHRMDATRRVYSQVKDDPRVKKHYVAYQVKRQEKQAYMYETYGERMKTGITLLDEEWGGGEERMAEHVVREEERASGVTGALQNDPDYRSISEEEEEDAAPPPPKKKRKKAKKRERKWDKLKPWEVDLGGGYIGLKTNHPMNPYENQ